jgi:MFS family permease
VFSFACLVPRSYFKELRYLTIFIAASLGVFPLFVPPFFLPLYGTSMGLSHSSSAGLAAGFNLASAVGRIAFGLLADRIGPINSLIIAFVTNAISLLLVWPLSGSVGPLIVFVILTGVAAGACGPNAQEYTYPEG